MTNRIFFPLWMHTVIALPTEKITDTANQLDVTYAHLYNIITDLEKAKYITMTKSGRITAIKLTPKGEKIKAVLSDLFEIYGREVK